MDVQSQTKIVGILAPSAVFFSLLARLLVLPKLVIAVNSPTLEGQEESKVSQQFGPRLWLLKRTKHENNHNGRPIDRRRMTTSVEGWGHVINTGVSTLNRAKLNLKRPVI